MDNLSVYAALAAAKAQVGAVAKKERNAQQGFNFRGIDAVVNAVAGPLNEHGVIVTPEVLEYSYETVEIGKNRTSMGHVTGKVRYTFHGPDGSSVSAVVLSESMDSGDKAVAKMMSVAYRIALLQVLNLPTDEPDPDGSSYERAAKPEIQDLVTQATELETLDDLRSLWERVGAAGYLHRDIAHPETGEKVKFQDYLKLRSDQLAVSKSPDGTGADPRAAGNPGRRPR